MNDLVNALLNGAKETIRFVEAQAPDVGGVIHYTVIRKNFPIRRDSFDISECVEPTGLELATSDVTVRLPNPQTARHH